MFHLSYSLIECRLCTAGFFFLLAAFSVKLKLRAGGWIELHTLCPLLNDLPLI